MEAEIRKIGRNQGWAVTCPTRPGWTGRTPPSPPYPRNPEGHVTRDVPPPLPPLGPKFHGTGGRGGGGGGVALWGISAGTAGLARPEVGGKVSECVWRVPGMIGKSVILGKTPFLVWIGAMDCRWNL